MSRCLYNSDFATFLYTDSASINPNKNPSGFWEDSTRLPKFYDGTYQYLKNLGIEEI